MARNAGWMFAGQGISVVNQAIYFLLLARVLGVGQYGVWVGANAAVWMVCQFSSLGCGFLFLRYVGSGQGRISDYWGNILVVTVSLGLMLSAALYALGRVLLPATPGMLLLSLAVAECVFGQLTLCCGQIFQAFEKMRVTATLNVATNALRMALAACWFLRARHASATEWTVTSLGISCFMAVAAVTMVWRAFGRPTFNARLLRRRAGEGIVFSATGSTTTACNDLDKAMLAHYGMIAANGTYSMAYRAVDVACIPIRSIHSAAFPRFFRQGVDGVGATARYAASLLRRTAPIGVAVGAAMYVLAPLVPTMAGGGFMPSVEAIRWLAPIPLLRCLHLSAGDALAGAGRQRYRLWAQGIATAANFAMNLVLIPRYSWRGAAFASLLTDGGLVALSWGLLLMLQRREGSVRGLVTVMRTTASSAQVQSS